MWVHFMILWLLFWLAWIVTLSGASWLAVLKSCFPLLSKELSPCSLGLLLYSLCIFYCPCIDMLLSVESVCNWITFKCYSWILIDAFIHSSSKNRSWCRMLIFCLLCSFRQYTIHHLHLLVLSALILIVLGWNNGNAFNSQILNLSIVID